MNKDHYVVLKSEIGTSDLAIYKVYRDYTDLVILTNIATGKTKAVNACDLVSIAEGFELLIQLLVDDGKKLDSILDKMRKEVKEQREKTLLMEEELKKQEDIAEQTLCVAFKNVLNAHLIFSIKPDEFIRIWGNSYNKPIKCQRVNNE